jgi:hypothetical protein
MISYPYLFQFTAHPILEEELRLIFFLNMVWNLIRMELMRVVFVKNLQRLWLGLFGNEV